MALTLQYELNENDYLQFQLYLASKRPSVKKARKNNWLFTPIAFIIIGFFLGDDSTALYVFGFFALVWLLAYPSYARRYYEKFYSTFSNDTYQGGFGKPVETILGPDEIQYSDFSCEAKFYHSSLNEIVETGHYFYLGLKTGGHLILPKSGMNNPEEVKNELTELSRKLGINYVQELNWKWK